MAKQEISYICEVCGLKYQKQEIAENCESRHYKPTKIIGFTYDLQDKKLEYPLHINVHLKDGNGSEKTIVYSRK